MAVVKGYGVGIFCLQQLNKLRRISTMNKNMNKRLIAMTAGAALLAAAQSSFAGSVVIGPLHPTITLSSDCTASLTAASDFGSYPTTQASPLTITPAGSVAVTCSIGVPYAILVDGGLHYDLDGSGRRILLGASDPVNHMMQYILRKGATAIEVGDIVDPLYPSYDPTYIETTSSNATTGTGNGNSQSYVLTARVLISTSRFVDNYTDTVAVWVQL